MQPKVSVIVPVYKVDRYLTQCLTSIVNQTLKEIEIIIVDEGEHDRCREIIDFFEKNDSRVVAPHQKNGGYGASCNYGFEIAKGEYVAIVESDDWIEPEMYEEMYAYAKKLDADVVKTPYSEYFSDGTKRDCSYRKHMASVTPHNVCFSMKEFGEMLEIHASLWAGLYKTEYMRKNNIQFIKAKGGAYVDVGFRIDTLVNSDKIAWLDKPYYNYRVDAIGSTTNNFKLSPMIQRWREVHEKFIVIQDDYDKFYGKHLIIDEFLNTIGWIVNMKTSCKQVKEISKNFDFIKESVVFDSKILSKEQKWVICFFKKHPLFSYFYLSNIRRFQKMKERVGCVLDMLSRPFVFFVIFCGYFVVNTSNIMIKQNSANVSFVFMVLFISYFSIALLNKILRKYYPKFSSFVKKILYAKYDR